MYAHGVSSAGVPPRVKRLGECPTYTLHGRTYVQQFFVGSGWVWSCCDTIYPDCHYTASYSSTLSLWVVCRHAPVDGCAPSKACTCEVRTQLPRLYFVSVLLILFVPGTTTEHLLGSLKWVTPKCKTALQSKMFAKPHRHRLIVSQRLCC